MTKRGEWNEAAQASESTERASRLRVGDTYFLEVGEKPALVAVEDHVHRLTDGELVDLDDEIKKLGNDEDCARKVYEEAAAVAKAKKDQVAAISKLLWTKRDTRREGTIVRPTKCGWFPELASKRMLFVRLDTGEVIRDRPMNADELQKRLFAIEPANEARA